LSWVQLCWILFWKSFPEHFTSYFSEFQRISEDYFGALVLFSYCLIYRKLATNLFFSKSNFVRFLRLLSTCKYDMCAVWSIWLPACLIWLLSCSDHFK
jgi:hypothetical protein